MPFNPDSILEIRRQVGIHGQLMPVSHLAKALKVDERSVRNWEKGESEPRFGMLQRLDGFCQQHGLEPHFYGPPQDGAI